MLGLADEYSKIMGGGVSSDTGWQQALDILKASYSKGQLAGAIGIMRQDIAARQKALVGSNRYLQRQYALPVQTSMTAMGVSLAAARQLQINQGKTDDQIRADITARGHQVLP
jgi:hypothetical protein